MHYAQGQNSKKISGEGAYPPPQFQPLLGRGTPFPRPYSLVAFGHSIVHRQLIPHLLLTTLSTGCRYSYAHL